jgi:DNA-directed RNA polymerase subunit K/omega
MPKGKKLEDDDTLLDTMSGADADEDEELDEIGDDSEIDEAEDHSEAEEEGEEEEGEEEEPEEEEPEEEDDIPIDSQIHEEEKIKLSQFSGLGKTGLMSMILNKFEKTAIIGFRAQQIASGSEPYVETVIGDTPITIAAKELDQHKLPFRINRKYPRAIADSYRMINVGLDSLLDVHL